MKSSQLLICIFAFSTVTVSAQFTQPPASDSTSIFDSMIIEYPPSNYLEEYPEYEVLPAINKFIYKKSIKTEDKPDKKASYIPGTGELLKHIRENVSVPYKYNNLSHYVFIQVTVGKDSLLYNPVILMTDGADYSSNALTVIESLPMRFNPATKNGKPVDSILIIPVRFTYKRSRY